MRRWLLPLLLACGMGPLAGAESVALSDARVVPGVRVGPITKGMTRASLKALVGPDQFKAIEVAGGEGDTLPGAVVFKGTAREVEVVFNPEGDKKEIIDVRIIGNGWKFPDDLRKGMTLEQVEKVNGKPFKVLGFEWDYGGYADFTGGKLAGKVSVRFTHHQADLDHSLVGDREIASTDKKLRAAKPVVSEISIGFPLEKTPEPPKP